MVDSMSRALVETVVKKTLRDLKRSPERSLRNLVDMALDFSEGRFQRTFLEAAQTMLENERSPYYALIRDVVAHVDGERLLRFGMDLGYNSCTAGAAVIRGNEARRGHDIPWTVALDLDPARLTERRDRYDTIVSQGEALGIYTWMLFCRGPLRETLPLIQGHPDSAFILFCAPEDIDPPFLDRISALRHLMLAVRYEKGAEAVCELLRARELLYSIYARYTDSDVARIADGSFFRAAERLHPVFTGLIARPDCSRETIGQAAQAVRTARNGQLFQTIPWEVIADASYIDGIISDDACSALFDREGRLYANGEQQSEDRYNIFHADLAHILAQAFPKRRQTAQIPTEQSLPV